MTDDSDVPNLTGVVDVGSAVGLEVQSRDVHGAYLFDLRRQEVDLGADEVWNRERFFGGQVADLDVAGGLDLFVDKPFDLVGFKKVLTRLLRINNG